MNPAATLLPWHTELWQVWQHYLTSGRIPQALLLTGLSGVGKANFAAHLTGSLLCPQRNVDGFACAYCATCNLQRAGSHPDFIRLAPESADKVLSIDTIRALLPILNLKPQYEAFRVVLIHAAEQLNTAAANAFLKCLEEPSERTVIVLLSAQAYRLPKTILSRCQRVNFAIPTPAIALDWLRQQGITHEAEALLTLAQGAPLLALHYAKVGTLQQRNTCFADWLAIAKGQRDPISIAAQWQKLPLSLVLPWLLDWVSALIKSRYQIPLALPERESAALHTVQKRLHLTALFTWYAALLRARQQATAPLNKQLVLEALLIEWFNLNCNA